MENTPRLQYTLFKLRRRYTIYQNEWGLLYLNGKYERTLSAGQYDFGRWQDFTIVIVDQRQISEVISGQEMLTADHIDVRISLVVQYAVTDPVLALHTVQLYHNQLYHDLQLALREAVAGRELDAILNTRNEIGNELLAQTAPLAKTYGITLARIGVRDIILPKNVRDVMMKEVEAQREGRASLIRAQHETAAARARANTAKILADNPQIVRLQELDALVELASRQGNVVLLPNLANLLTPRE